MKEILTAIKTNKALINELTKTKENYGNNIDKYSRKINVSGTFDWYYGSYGSSSIHKVPAIRYIRQNLVNKVLTEYINNNFDEVVTLIAKAHMDIVKINKPKVQEQLDMLNEIIELGD